MMLLRPWAAFFKPVARFARRDGMSSSPPMAVSHDVLYAVSSASTPAIDGVRQE